MDARSDSTSPRHSPSAVFNVSAADAGSVRDRRATLGHQFIETERIDGLGSHLEAVAARHRDDDD